MGADFKDYNPSNEKVSFATSLALHIIVFGGFFLFAYLGDAFKSEQKIDALPFTLVPTPDMTSSDSEPAAQEKVQDIKVKKLEDLKPVELPEPEPEPQEPQPKPDPKPEPKEEKSEPKKATISESNNAKPAKTISKAEFDKLNPKKDRSKPAPTRPRKSVDFSAVKLDSSKVKFDVKPSSSGSSVPSSALNMYAGHIQKKVRAIWIIPIDCARLGLSVKLDLLISSSGRVLKAKIVRSSGNSDFDESVNKVFRNISFNPPPGGEEFSAQMTFIEEDF